MPRGLGDNPLKRERKARRGIHQAVHMETVPSAEQTPPPADSVGLDSLEDQSKPPSRSFNDVFFQRRPEDIPGPDIVPQDVAAVPVPADVVASPLEVITEPAPEFTAPAVSESPPLEPEPTPPAEVSPQPIEVSPQVPVVAEVPAPPKQEQSEEHKSGFLGRFFSKFRKS